MAVISKAWNWDIATALQWEEPAGEVYPLINRWKENKFKKVLDLGCGIGRHATLLAQKGFEVSASDLGKEGLKKLESAAKKTRIIYGYQTRRYD